jgi:hypothetical protein
MFANQSLTMDRFDERAASPSRNRIVRQQPLVSRTGYCERNFPLVALCELTAHMSGLATKCVVWHSVASMEATNPRRLWMLVKLAKVDA